MASALGCEEVRIASARSDGTLRNPVTVWLVRNGEDLIVRSVNGRGSTWFRGVQNRHEGRIWAAGVQKDVTFVETNDDNNQIDALYSAKYHRYPRIVPDIVNDNARAATLKLLRADTDSGARRHVLRHRSRLRPVRERRTGG